MENTTGLVPGVDYPRTFRDVDEWFRTDAACRGYIRRLRWPGGFICPFCGWAGEPWETSRGLLHCRGCQGADLTMPRAHNIAALLKRWMLGTHQGGVQHVHLDYYLDEFAFRFN